MSIPYKRIEYKVAPEDSRAWKCNWRNCAGGIGLSDCGICSFRGRWDTSYCPLFITIGNLEAKSNVYKKWCKVAEVAVGSLHYYVCGSEIILRKKVGRFELAEMESWMNTKGKPPSPWVINILDCLKILHDQGEHRIIKSTFEDISIGEESFVDFIMLRAKIVNYAKKMGLDIGMKRKKDGIIHIFNRVSKQKQSPENGGKGEVSGHEHIGNGEEVPGGKQDLLKEVR